MNRKSALGILIMLVVVLLTVLPACASGQQPSPTQASPKPTQASPTQASPTQVSPKPTQAAPTQAAPAQTITLKFNAGVYVPESVGGRHAKWFGDEIEKRTNGLVKMQYFFANSLSKPGEELDTVASGQADFAYVQYVNYPSKLALNGFNYAIPFAPSDLNMQYGILDKLYTQIPELAQEFEQNGVSYVAFNICDPFELQSRMPIRTMDDFPGKKVATAGPVFAKVAAAAGATPVQGTVWERQTMFQTGMIDASILPLDVAATVKLYEFAKYTTMVDLGAWTCQGQIMNAGTLKKLPESAAKVVQDVSKESAKKQLDLLLAYDAQLKETMKAAGTTFYDFPASEKAKWYSKMSTFPADWVKAGGDKVSVRQKIVDTYLSLCKQAGYKFPGES